MSTTGSGREERAAAQPAVAAMETTCALVDQLGLLLVSVRAYGVEHPSTERAATAVAEAITAAAPPFALQFMVSAVFRDRELVPLDGDRYDRAMSIAEALHRGGAQEIAFVGDPSAEEIAIFGGALLSAGAKPPRAKHATSGAGPARPKAAEPLASIDFDALGLTTLAFREIPDAQPGAELETVEKEIFVSAQLVLALRAGRRAIDAAKHSGGAWPFASGMEVVRRLERAMETHPTFTASMLEIAPGVVDVARRALNAGHHVAAVLGALQSPRATTRAAIHAVVVLASVGLGGRDGVAFRVAATAARDAVTAALHGTAFDPHRYAVASILADLADQRALATAELFGLAYVLERRRCPNDVAFDLTLPDLLSNELTKLGDDPARAASTAAMWLRLRILVAGALPPGARVRLADGRRGIVLGPGPSGDPMLPDVLVNGQREVLRTPPRLEGTPGAAPRTKSMRPGRARTPKPAPAVRAAPPRTPTPTPAKPVASPPGMPRTPTPAPAKPVASPPGMPRTPTPAPAKPAATPVGMPRTPAPAPAKPARATTPPPIKPARSSRNPPAERSIPPPKPSQRGSGRDSKRPAPVSRPPASRRSEAPRRAATRPDLKRSRTAPPPRRDTPPPTTQRSRSQAPVSPETPRAPVESPRRRVIVPREDEGAPAERVEVLAPRKPVAPAASSRDERKDKGSARGLVAREDVSTRRGRHDPRSDEEDS